MNRRSFFRSMVGGVAATAAVRTWPFRVFSFPAAPQLLTMKEISNVYLVPAIASLFNEIDRSLEEVNVRPRFLIDREVLTVESWDAQGGTMQLRIPGRSKEPFTGIITS